MGEVTGEELSAGGAPLQEALRSGVALCLLANAVSPGAVPRINKVCPQIPPPPSLLLPLPVSLLYTHSLCQGAMPFPQRENIKAFCDAVRRSALRAPPPPRPPPSSGGRRELSGRRAQARRAGAGQL